MVQRPLRPFFMGTGSFRNWLESNTSLASGAWRLKVTAPIMLTSGEEGVDG